MPANLDLEAYLHEHIPLSSAMGVRVLNASLGEVRLHAPLAPNINHQLTAFGGSISTLATLAAWSHVQWLLNTSGRTANLVIQNHSVEYLRPITDDLEAVATPFAAEEVERFLKTLSERGRARIAARAEVVFAGQVCAKFEGRFVAIS